MQTSSWLESLLLPHALRRELVRAWLSREPLSDALQNEWDARMEPGQRRVWARALRRRCRDEGVHVLVPDGEGYPRTCLQLHDPPAVLFVRGDVSLLRPQQAVSVVGARRGTERGRLCAETLGAELAASGLPVVSGLAYGVDGASHRGCLAAGGRPIGVLGTGVLQTYPAGHHRLHEQVLAAGCLVSEYEPDEGAMPYRFIARNRLIAALGRALVVVEAGRRSGALSTVEFALQLGLEVMVVPGPVDCPHAAGCLQLLRDGATPVRDAQDVLETLGLPVVANASDARLAGRSLTPEEIAREMGWSLEEGLVRLSELEASGRVRRLPGGRYAMVPRGSEGVG